THDFPPYLRVYSSGRVERLKKTDFVPPGEDPDTGVVSRDAVISPGKLPSYRVFLPKIENHEKVPLIIYFHGGAFCFQSAFSSEYTKFGNRLAAAARSVVVSVEYRLAPEHLLPACYHDAFEAAKWVGLHALPGGGPDPWLNDHADFARVIASGDSAGANIAHHVVTRSKNGSDGAFGFEFSGLILIHPYFGMGQRSLLWDYLFPEGAATSDPRQNPPADNDFPANLRCDRILICTAELDSLREKGEIYFRSAKERQWSGEIELFESPGESHVFHLFDPSGDAAVSLMNHIVGFI
ncbi:hypothetical protein M569_17456, partial [Genlisea aurea]